jgi:hypothetical protein
MDLAFGKALSQRPQGWSAHKGIADRGGGYDQEMFERLIF